MNTSYYWSQKDLNNFDSDLQTFYYNVIRKELNLFQDANVKSIKLAFREIVNAYKKETVDSHSSNINFDLPEKRCAYVMKHCPIFTNVVSDHFIQLLRANPSVLSSAIHRRNVNLCCIGGGPATDAVAIVRIINYINKTLKVLSREKLNLTIWVVDRSEEWKQTASLVIQTLSEVKNFGNSENMTLSFQFLKADLTDTWTKELKKILTDADIVTMVYFVSAVNGSKVMDKCLYMLQNIMESLKPGALLFYLDSAKELHYNTISSAASSFSNLKRIYGPCEQILHTLSLKSIKKFIEIYFSKFNVLCLTNCFVTCCAWMKETLNCKFENSTQALSFGFTHSQRYSLESNTCNIQQKTRNWNKIVARNTKKQKDYRERVEKLLLSELNIEFPADDLYDCDICFELEDKLLYERTFFASKSKRKRIYT